jgi:hypothetical protein
MSEECYVILQLVRLCKRYQVSLLAANAASRLLVQGNFQAEVALQAAKDHLKTDLTVEVDDAFRQIETALIDGSDFLPPLRELLERRQSKP